MLPVPWWLTVTTSTAACTIVSVSIGCSRLPCAIYCFAIKTRASLAWSSLRSRPVWGLVTRERARVVSSLFIVISSHVSFPGCLSRLEVCLLCLSGGRIGKIPLLPPVGRSAPVPAIFTRYALKWHIQWGHVSLSISYTYHERRE